MTDDAQTDDFIISIHALERFEERFQRLWTNDTDVGQLIYNETMEAFEAGRVSTVPPLELANYDLNRWGPGNSKIVWTPDKARGYVLVDGSEGLTVATVLVGQTNAEARSRLYSKKQIRRKR